MEAAKEDDISLGIKGFYCNADHYQDLAMDIHRGMDMVYWGT